MIDACRKGETAFVKRYIREGVDVNRPDHVRKRRTLKHLAIKCSVRQILLQYYYVYIMQNGLTPLHHASEHGHVAIIKLLIKSGARFDVQAKVRQNQ